MSKYKIVKTAIVCLAGMILVSPVDVILRYDSAGLRQGRVQKGKDDGVGFLGRNSGGGLG